MTPQNIFEEDEKLPKYCPDCDSSGWDEYLGPFEDQEGIWWWLYKCTICHFEVRKKAKIDKATKRPMDLKAFRAAAALAKESGTITETEDHLFNLTTKFLENLSKRLQESWKDPAEPLVFATMDTCPLICEGDLLEIVNITGSIVIGYVDVKKEAGLSVTPRFEDFTKKLKKYLQESRKK